MRPRFEGVLLTSWDLGGRYVKLERPFSFIDSDGSEWRAPAGLVCDGASIPQPAWSLVGGPFNGKHRRAAILHDAAYCASGELQTSMPGVKLRYTRADADRMFYEAMRCDGVNWLTAQTMWLAVRLGGWLPWDEDKERKSK